MPYAQTGTKIAHMGDSDHQLASPGVDAAILAVAAHLRAERGRANLKQTDLAELTGLSINTIQRLENGEREMKLSQLFPIAAALGIEPGVFIDDAQASMRK